MIRDVGHALWLAWQLREKEELFQMGLRYSNVYSTNEQSISGVCMCY